MAHDARELGLQNVLVLGDVAVQMDEAKKVVAEGRGQTGHQHAAENQTVFVCLVVGPFIKI